ncbi:MULTISPECIES: glycosyltransferase [Cyanophyceae]|uniref:glycosyltransferase n=1 Tax=Cyanophyceae TaxID=3028117 RepID=UPI001689E542|nr:MULTISPECIES: glycosyltransferase [Cyanophyceae]MBD1914967.1 glycosyltransferase [Phormidium sp. FACHB-77]MBD2032754.1 glycosyltransferase [Phormidium sp. FACHB-322]MBD2049899.1 glycosyltransferase [Leptolyngbya sp. FACHB-60]
MDSVLAKRLKLGIKLSFAISLLKINHSKLSKRILRKFNPLKFIFGQAIPDVIATHCEINDKQGVGILIQRLFPKSDNNSPIRSKNLYGGRQKFGFAHACLSYSDGEHVAETGKVEDVRPYFAQSVAMCAPLSSGSGSKYKLLEALSAGVPIVCSSLALEWLSLTPEVCLLSTNTDQDVASALLRLMNDTALGARLAHQGRALVSQHYSWDVSLQGIDQWLNVMASMPKRITQ